MRLYTGKALASVLGMTAGEIESMRKSGVISFRKGKTYDLEECAAAIISHYKSDAGKKQTETADYATERALLMRAKRLEQEYEMGLKEGTLHEAKDVEMILTTMLLNFRSRIMAIPSKLAARLSKENDTTTIFNILKEATDDALNELSDYERLFQSGSNTEEN